MPSGQGGLFQPVRCLLAAPRSALPMSRSTSEDNLWIQIKLDRFVLSPAKGFECQGPGTSRQTAFLLSNWLSVAYSPLALYSCSGKLALNWPSDSAKR